MTSEPAPEIPDLDHEPQESYSPGDIVKLKTSMDPDARYLLTEPIHDGLTAGFKIDENGQGISDLGTVGIEDIAQVVGHKPVDQAIKIYEATLNNVYNNTLPKDVVARLVAKAFADITK